MAGVDATGKDLERLVGLVRGRRYAAAIDGLKQFLAEFPDNEVAAGLLGATYFEIGLPDQALLHYRRVIELNADNALARFQIGMVHLSRGEHRAALEAWAPLTTDPREFMAHFHSALAYLELGDAARAREMLEEAGKNMPVGHPLFAQLKALRARLAGDAPASGNGYTK
jgi:tetratricopeptide (TPR) repeat protein